MIDRYLRELVQNNHRVIIPDFGAFLKKDKGATLMEDAVTFSPFLRFNDGLLESYVVEKEKIEREKASEEVSRYVQNVKQTIAGRRPYYVDELGAFYEDERGSVQFLFAKTEKEALSKFERVVSAAQVSTPTFMSEVEINSPEVVEPMMEEKKKVAKKKVVEVIPEEEDDDVAEVEEVKTVSARGRKKADVKEVKESSAKDNNAVAKTIINVNVTTEKSKEEQVRAEEKAKQLEVANSSLQRWMEDVEKRKGEQAQEEKKALESQVQATQEELEAQRRRREEIEHALTEKKRRDEEDAKRRAEEEEAKEREREAALTAKAAGEKEEKSKQQSSLPAVWEEEVVERKKGSRGAVLLLVVILVVLSLAGVLWFWTPISEALGWESEYELSDEVMVESYYADPIPSPKAVQPVSSPFPKQQAGVYYVVMAQFASQDMAMKLFLQLKNQGLTPEIVVTNSSLFAVCVGKYSSLDEAKSKLGNYRGATILP